MSAVLTALRAMHGGKATFDLGRATLSLLHPGRASDFIDVVGPPLAGMVMGFAWSAYLAARHGVKRPGT